MYGGLYCSFFENWTFISNFFKKVKCRVEEVSFVTTCLFPLCFISAQVMFLIRAHLCYPFTSWTSLGALTSQSLKYIRASALQAHLLLPTSVQ